MNYTVTSLSPCPELSEEEQYETDRINAAYLYFLLYIPIAINFAGAITNSIFLYFSIKGMYRRILTSKMYLFLVNKSVGDLFTSIIGFMFYFLNLKDEIGSVAANVIVVIIGISYWSSSFTYLFLSVLKLVAIRKPLLYRRKIVPRMIVKVLLAFWPLAVIIEITSPNFLELINPDESCLQFYRGPLAIINTLSHAIVFLLVVTSCATALYLARKNQTERLANLQISESRKESRSTNYYIMLTGFVVYSLC